MRDTLPAEPAYGGDQSGYSDRVPAGIEVDRIRAK